MKGYTLIEMMITTAVFALCLTLVTSSMIYGVNVYNSVKSNMETKGELLTAFDAMRNDLKNLIVKPSLMSGEISSATKKSASWTIYSSGQERSVQYSIEDGILIRTVDGKKTILLKGECEFEVKFITPKLAWVSLKHRKETLASHIRPQLTAFY